MTMLAHVFTNTDTDHAAEARVIDDGVVRLREWGTATIHVLPRPPVNECTVGTDETCVLRLDDPSRRVSRLHARLVRDHTRWLVVCATEVEDCERYRVMPIGLPPLAGRGAELDRIIHEYAEDAMAELATPRTELSAADVAWVREHACTSLPEIEKATLRLVALRTSRNLSHAAARLGMAPVSLSRWIGRRRMPMQIVH